MSLSSFIGLRRCGIEKCEKLVYVSIVDVFVGGGGIDRWKLVCASGLSSYCTVVSKQSPYTDRDRETELERCKGVSVPVE